VFDLGGAITVSTTSGVASAEEIQIVNGSTVTLTSGHFEAGVDPEQGGMLIDEDSELIISSSATMANQGSLDIIGAFGVGGSANGTLSVQPGGGFDDFGMILGADAGAHGEVIIDAAFAFEVNQSGSHPGDGVLVIGEDGDGTVDITDTPVTGSAFTIIGKNDGSNGELDLNNSSLGGSTMTIGPAGTGVVNIGAGSVMLEQSTTIGPNGTLNVTGTPASPGLAEGLFTLDYGTMDVSGGGEIVVGGGAASSGAVSVGGTILAGLGEVVGDVDLNGGTVEAILPLPGTLLIKGNVNGTGSIEPLQTLEVNGGIAAGVDIAFSETDGALGDLVLDVPAANLGTITGFDVGHTIDVMGSQFTDALFTPGTSAGAAGTLTLSGDGLTPLQFAVEGDYLPGSFLATPGTSNDTIVTLCFLAGTRIATPDGEVPVERLATGDPVCTLSGATRRIAWIGTGRVLATRGRRNAATPVIVRKGALADNVPHRDLRITKGHSLFIDGVLIPVEELVNHRSILWDDRAQEVCLYHIELDTHDVLIADGAPAESYRDDGNRWLFRNANSGWHLPPQEPCAPLLTGGPAVDAIWQRLLDRAGPRPGVPLTDDPDLHLLVDGRRIDPVSRSGRRHVFRIGTRPVSIRIASRCGVPQELGLARDPRCLGVALRRIIVEHGVRIRAAEADDPRLSDGFHAFEPDNGLRWTDGCAAVPAEIFAGFGGGFSIVLQLAATAGYPDEGEALRVA
jgi:hypothetical protein